MKQIFKITYPTGKIYIGKDTDGRCDDFGSPNQLALQTNFDALPKSSQTQYNITKEILWESYDCSGQTLASKHLELIHAHQSNQPHIGYNQPVPALHQPVLSSDGVRIGVDGCKAGWFYVAISSFKLEFGIISTLEALFSQYGAIEEIVVDIPIGLFDEGSEPRACDIQARKLLKPRGSTVFPAPLRPCLKANDYEHACVISKKLSGKSLSKQAYNIFNKIDEVDSLLRSYVKYQGVIKEAHPELGFRFLNNGVPLLSRKKDRDGLEERLKLLSQTQPFAHDIYTKALAKYPRKQLAKDDIVDALMCLAISSALLGRRKILPTTRQFDNLGIEMAMHYSEFGFNS
jgi:predicted RNase H-like nuclease